MNKPKLNQQLSAKALACAGARARVLAAINRLAAATLLLMAAGLASLAQAAQPLVLDETTLEVQAWPAVSVLADPQKNLTIEQVLNLKADFKTPTTAYGTLGLRTDAQWLHIPVNVAEKAGATWVLDIDYSPINRIDVFVVTNGNVVQKAVLGNLQRRDGRMVSSRANSVVVGLKGGVNYELYLRVENSGSMILPITLNNAAAFHHRALSEQMLQGLLTGLALCLLVYSLAQWVSLGEHLFVKYAILISGSLLFSLLQFGVGAQYIWPGNFWMELHAGGLSALIAATGSFLFIQQALAGPDLKPWLSRLMSIGASLTIISAVCFAFDWITVYQVTTIVSTLGLLPSLLGLPGAISRARRGDRVGIYFLVAWAVYLVTTAILIEVIKGRIGVNFWSLHSFQFGASIDMLLFMRVLGLRTKALQTAMQHATNERESLVTMANTDPLTGLPNRRSLNSSVSSAIQHAGPDKLLAVYMLDLDGFKQVNDQYGHDVGDDLLVAVAARLKANLRNSDVVSRLGGDEFLVMSVGLKNPNQAQELGEKLLKAFREPFVLSAQTCSVGLTIGYALAPLDGNDSRALLKRADAAMYAGKQDGKNCVRRGEIGAA
jgi:diguanylate cyclase (GGDEF)-like protein